MMEVRVDVGQSREQRREEFVARAVGLAQRGFAPQVEWGSERFLSRRERSRRRDCGIDRMVGQPAREQAKGRAGEETNERLHGTQLCGAARSAESKKPCDPALHSADNFLWLGQRMSHPPA